MNSSGFEPVANPNGTFSLRDPRTGEAMHSWIGPWEEANLLYIQQSRLAERLARPASGASFSPDPLVVHDVGLGIAANSLAAIACRERLAGGPPARPLEIHSFENDPRGLAAALEEPEERFPFLAPYRDRAAALLQQGEWNAPDGSVRWVLHAGSYLDRLPGAPAAEVVFWDFYSPRSCPELWRREVFERVHASLEPRRSRGLGTDLYTYSAATPVRAALLLAGFYVGYGCNTATKNDTTIASTRLRDVERPLEARWLAKAECSTKLDRETWLRVRAVEQFREM